MNFGPWGPEIMVREDLCVPPTHTYYKRSFKALYVRSLWTKQLLGRDGSSLFLALLYLINTQYMTIFTKSTVTRVSWVKPMVPGHPAKSMVSIEQYVH